MDIILGRPWLAQYQPSIHWYSGEIFKWSECCIKECIKELPEIPCDFIRAIICSTSVESPDSQNAVKIPAEYRAFQDMFSKSAAIRLLPHWPWACTIDLLPGAKSPKGQIYTLSILESTAMEEYIKEALNQGFICPSTSPAAFSFFFVAKKDGGLCPCIDYQTLNSQTVCLSSSSDLCGLRRTLWSLYLFQIGFPQCLQSHPYP